MAEIIFEGDWNQEQIAAIAQAAKVAVNPLHKSLGVSDGGGAEATVQTTIAGLLSPRQKRLIDLLKQGGEKAFYEGLMREHGTGQAKATWEDYQSDSLTKAIIGSVKYVNGKAYQFNQNHRWQSTEGGSELRDTQAIFNFPVTSGEFGRGVYFPIAYQPQGGLVIRCMIALPQKSLITADEFNSLEEDFTSDLNLLLNVENIGGVVRLDDRGLPDMLFVRFPQDIQVLGAVSDSGTVPEGDTEYYLLNLERQDSHAIAEIEVRPVHHNTLSKSAKKDNRKTFKSQSDLNGIPLVILKQHQLDRGLVREAIERCKLDGVDLSGIHIRLSQGVPDILPMPVRAYCLPSDRTIYLAPHDPQQAITKQVSDLADRLRRSVAYGALDPDHSLQILQTAAQLSPAWYLEGIIKFFAGAIHCNQVSCIMGGDLGAWQTYSRIAAMRGWTGSRRQLAEMAAHDYRCVYDPAGLPNLMSLEFDLLLPTIARLGQQELMNVLSKHRNPEQVGPTTAAIGNRAAA